MFNTQTLEIMEILVRANYIYKGKEEQSVYTTLSNNISWKLGVLEMTGVTKDCAFPITKMEIISAEDEDLAVIATYNADNNSIEFCHKLWEGTAKTNYNLIYLDDDYSMEELLALIEKQVIFFMENTSEQMITVRKSHLALAELDEEGIY